MGQREGLNRDEEMVWGEAGYAGAQSAAVSWGSPGACLVSITLAALMSSCQITRPAAGESLIAKILWLLPEDATVYSKQLV